MIDGEKTLLPLVHFDADHSWNDLWNLCVPFIETHGASMLRQRLDGIARSVAVERHYIDRDYRDTFSHFHSKRFNTPDSRTLRLHFFDRRVSRAELLDPTAAQAAYCGYAVVRPTRPSSLGRTMISPHKIPELRGAMVRTCSEGVTLQGTLLHVDGFPFISQDTDATVCAQSALWMLFRYFSTHYAHYREIRPFEITQLTKDYSIGRLFPTHGLTDWQMGEACRQLGFSPLIYTRTGFPASFDHLLYTYIESGVPVLAATRDHVFVVLGHRSDFSRVPPSDPRVPSSFCCTGYVINDDNRMPYQDLPLVSGVGSVPQVSVHGLDRLESFIAPLPEKVFLAAEHQQKVVERLLSDPVFGLGKNSPILASAQIVTRTFLTSGRSYKRKLSDRGMGHTKVAEFYRALPMPRFIWVTELSIAGNFPAETMGEVIWDATRNEHEVDGWIAVHYPEFLALDVGSALNTLPQFKDFVLDSPASYEPYKSNLECLT